MAPVLGSHAEDAALKRRLALAGSSGPMAVFQNLRVVGIAMFACLGGLLYGYNQGVFSGVLTMTAFGNHMGEYTTNSTKKGWLTSILELGAWFGTLYSGFLAETLSRKHAILINTVVFIVGVIIQCTGVTSAGANSILAGRFITGMGVDNAECAPPEIRGLLVGLQQFSIEFGIMISFWIDYGTNYIGGTGDGQSDAAWLVPLCLQLAPAILLFVGMIFMPYSPRWLVHHGREEEARKVIAQLRGDRNDEAVELEFLEIKAQSLFEKRSIAEKFPHLSEPSAMNTAKLQFVAIGSLFKTMPMFRRVIVATMTMFFQQWTGINAVLYYAPTIFAALGMSTNTTSLLATGVVGIVMFVTTIPMMLYVDKIGRKSVLISGAIAMAVCHLIIAVIFAKNQHQWPTHQSAGWAAVVMVWLFAANFGWSWGPCAWIIVAEVWPLSARPYGIALGASANWMNNFIVGQVTPDMITGMAYGTFIFFGLITLLGSVFVWVFVPETKQLTLEEMDVIFGSQGVAAADKERIDQIHRELGLADLYAAEVHEDVKESEKEKESVKEKETAE
ncbi:uncharacterized protein TRUGW13939_07403 [Talaromyces rugulosus]|uniref:Major facilitator superfamily (MFS) profile domain-containing protein n=1 Tax=Talaromyces rugulosus TaxID=121627 RepID=A0A7H8R1L7_TALRU|nr:uncharacterized protein TRUGW13939_07403 [Talaromyces rugulosus]QKX60260.1 hypothetical protein TRUGW13939_07403 [Talaromyces rugulosus]